MTATPVYKCPAAPYEAGDAHRSDALASRRRRAQIDLYAAEPGPMGVAGAHVSAGVRQVVESRGIRYHAEHQVTAVDATARRLTFANGATPEFDLLVCVPPHRSPAVVRAGRAHRRERVGPGYSSPATSTKRHGIEEGMQPRHQLRRA